MDRLIILIVVLAIVLIGRLRIIRHIRGMNDQSQFAQEYLGKIRDYVTSAGRDSKVYGWLIYESTKMQVQMGQHGVVAAYKPPYEDHYIRNYQLILNSIPELRRNLENQVFAESEIPHHIASGLHEAILRYLGNLAEAQKAVAKGLSNPFVWFHEGFRFVLSAPLFIVGSLGFMSESTVERLMATGVFMLVSASIALVGFLSSIITIVLGWKSFVSILRSLIHY